MVVMGYNDRAIKAEFRPEAAMALNLHIGRFDNSSKQKRDAWMQSALPEVVGTALSNLSFLRLPNEGKAEKLGAKAKGWKKSLKAANSDPATSLVLSGSLQRKGNTLAIKAAIRAAKTGAVVLAGQKRCPSMKPVNAPRASLRLSPRACLRTSRKSATSSRRASPRSIHGRCEGAQSRSRS